MATGIECMETAITTKPALAPAAAATIDTPPPALRTLLFCGAATGLCGILLFLCYFPAAWGTYLGWIALAPLLILVRVQMRPALIFLCSVFGGLVFFVPALSWMRVADRSMVLAWLMLSLYCSLYFTAAIFMVRGLDRWRLPLVLTVPIVWSALEFFRSFFLTGFAWYYLAHTQHDLLPMIQIADLGGLYLVTFVVAAVNAFLFDCAYQFPEIRRWFHQAELAPYRMFASLDILNRGFLADWLFRRNLLIEGAFLLALLTGTYAYGQIRLGQNSFSSGPIVCLLQSNLDQRLRENAQAPNGYHSIETVQGHFSDLCLVAAKNPHGRPDLVIWPETSFPVPWFSISERFPVEKMSDPEFKTWRDAEIMVRTRLRELTAQHTRVAHLIGMNSFSLDENGKTLRHNIALQVSPQGKIEAKYDKVHRVPFGEYVPLKDWLPFLSLLTPYEGDFGILAGEKYTRFESGKHRFGVLVCYEDTDPFLARQYLRDDADGKPVDFLVNISNDGWFDGSNEHEEHLAVSRFRAIECRRAMVRAVNMGVSAVVDGNGRVLKPRTVGETSPPMWVISDDALGTRELPQSEWHSFKKRPGVIMVTVPIDHRLSFYCSAGDWLPIGCWTFLLGAGAWAFWRRKHSALVRVATV